MGLRVLEKALKEAHKQIAELNFSDLIRKSRDILGLKQYRAAEFAGISQQRIKNLETGYFRDMPTHPELQALGALFDIKYSVLEEKAHEHVQERILDRKVRVIHCEEKM